MSKGTIKAKLINKGRGKPIPAEDIRDLAEETKDHYAMVVWTPQDVRRLRPHWSLTKCEEKLQEIERQLQDRTIALGWEVLESLLFLSDEEMDNG